MSYLELLKLAAPEAIVVVTALAVLTVGLTSTRAKTLCPIVAAIGTAVAIGAVLMLPSHANLFGGMLVISPLNSLFKIICLVLALVTVPLASSEKSLRNPGEYIAVLLLGSVGLMLLVRSEEFLMRFLLLRARRWRRSSCLEKLCWLVLRPLVEVPTGTRCSPAGRPCSPSSLRCRSCSAISWRSRKRTCVGCSLTRPSRMVATRYSGSSPEVATDFPRRCSTPAPTRSHSLARSRSSAWFAAKVAATIYKISPDWRRGRHSSLPRCRSSSCRSPVCHRWRDFLENSIFSARLFVPAEITVCFGSSRSLCSAASYRSTTT